MILSQIQYENNFLPTSKQWQAKVGRFLGLYLFVRLLHLSLKFSKWDAILAPVAKQWIAKDIPSYGSQSKRAKSAIHWFGKY